MAIKSILILSILSATFHYAIAAQNLCTTNPDVKHVVDRSSCSSYLYCRRNTTNPSQIISVHQLSCLGTGADYFESDQLGFTGSCVLTKTHCDVDIACPGSEFDDIMIADPKDSDCRRYRPCRLIGLPYLSCTAPLVFNRNTGSCDFAANAPCTPGGTKPDCPATGSGQFPGSTCYQYIYCFDGILHGTYECGVGLFFDATKSSCVADTAGSCIRPTIVDTNSKVKVTINNRKVDDQKMKNSKRNL